jgi:hypothetical protein
MTYNFTWELAQIATDPAVVTALVRNAPELPSYSKSLNTPIIGGEMEESAAVAFANQSLANAVVIAKSPASSPRTLERGREYRV